MSLALAFSTLTILLGCGFFAAGSIGLLRLPDLFSRLHALTKADNLGLGLVIIGLLPWVDSPWQGLKLVLIWLLVLLAGATGAHLVAKRALRGDGEDLK
ncbi:monovalent cation/H(+) antiporter subunit G [Marichromatium bheemlicum]|uniref:Monovalent cation/H(+) antiporter subunit G n=1 Tax=Marichromatium bheemlicum TaxID=365339 RepID=A0ABX1I6F9_9GAMM|nr:monovalent cation/H(+) antiporter subunit G [Marichromatium bheemlicum]NKN32761.1 monovalent cation/H(+) antiporter subunit G [Marichromatium bheemlicum]